MFICKKCVVNYEGSSVDYAEMRGPSSYGRCEDCSESEPCYDIWSGGNVKRKVDTKPL